MERQPRLVEALRGRIVVQVSCGHSHTLCLTETGDVFAFGSNKYGQLGLGTTDDALVPRLVEALQRQRASQVSCGNDHSLVLTDRGAVLSFGNGRDGRLGHGDELVRKLPTLVESLVNVVAIAVATGADHSLVLSGMNPSIVRWQ